MTQAFAGLTPLGRKSGWQIKMTDIRACMGFQLRSQAQTSFSFSSISSKSAKKKRAIPVFN
jgi:hypothetical protein